MRDCLAVQRSDSMVCDACERTWDMNDPSPPPCKLRAEIATGRTPCEAVNLQKDPTGLPLWNCVRCQRTWDEQDGARPNCTGWPMNAGNYLRNAEALFRQRNEVYQSNYQNMGALLLALFPPGGIPAITTEEAANRLNLLIDCLGKLQRYAYQFSNGGHRDSAEDLIVYAAMLREMT